MHAREMLAYDMDTHETHAMRFAGSFGGLKCQVTLILLSPITRHTVVGKRPCRSPYWPRSCSDAEIAAEVTPLIHPAPDLPLGRI
jgi:hypothetical protein